MNSTVMCAVVAITGALVLYTLGVFGERRAGILKRHHLVLFWLGLVCDSTGTALMSSIASSQPAGPATSLHAITGTLAIVLMLFHAAWATIVLVRGDEKARRSFHRLSICVWLVWLVPYLLGVFMGMSHGM